MAKANTARHGKPNSATWGREPFLEGGRVGQFVGSCLREADFSSIQANRTTARQLNTQVRNMLKCVTRARVAECSEHALGGLGRLAQATLEEA